ncbi:hypothetical protein B566_EDAN006664 [Ephemera danica]|nr:hypothetical protein B566_EDAN006664 [Ephemera danica]
MPARVVLGILSFFGFFVNYMLRVNMNIAIVYMTKSASEVSTSNQSVVLSECLQNVTFPQTLVNTTIDDETTDEGEFSWDAHAQGLILGSFYWSYIVSLVPGGILAERYGSKLVHGGANLVHGLMALATPLAARWNIAALIAVRLIQGFVSGMTWPSMHAMSSRWIPPHERSKFTSTYMEINQEIGTSEVEGSPAPLERSSVVNEGQDESNPEVSKVSNSSATIQQERSVSVTPERNSTPPHRDPLKNGESDDVDSLESKASLEIEQRKVSGDALHHTPKESAPSPLPRENQKQSDTPKSHLMVRFLNENVKFDLKTERSNRSENEGSVQSYSSSWIDVSEEEPSIRSMSEYSESDKSNRKNKRQSRRTSRALPPSPSPPPDDTKPKLPYEIQEYKGVSYNLTFDIDNTGTTFKVRLPTLKRREKVYTDMEKFRPRQRPHIKRAVRNAIIRHKEYNRLNSLDSVSQRAQTAAFNHIVRIDNARRIQVRLNAHVKGVKDLPVAPTHYVPSVIDKKKRPRAERFPAADLHGPRRLQAARRHYIRRSDVVWMRGLRAPRCVRTEHEQKMLPAHPTEHDPWWYKPPRRNATRWVQRSHSLCGLLIYSFGSWVWAFYVPAVLCLIWCIFWWFFVYDSPAKHPFISPKERAYLERNIAPHLDGKM